MMEAIRSSEPSTLTKAMWRRIREDGILLAKVISPHANDSQHCQAQRHL
jgi:hypothetical protein